MPSYNAPIRDFEFVLKELLEIDKQKHLKGFDEIDESLVDSLLAEGGKLCEEVLFPLNQRQHWALTKADTLSSANLLMDVRVTR